MKQLWKKFLVWFKPDRWELVEALHQAFLNQRREFNNSNNATGNVVLCLLMQAGGEVTISADMIASVTHNDDLRYDIQMDANGDAVVKLVLPKQPCNECDCNEEDCHEQP